MPTDSPTAPILLSQQDARARKLPPDRLSALLLRHGTLELRWYAPPNPDPQIPHDRDELYVVVSGRGWFVRGEDRVAFNPGDALFVPAHVPHRFEDFTPDLATWVVFYGPVGGEAA